MFPWLWFWAPQFHFPWSGSVAQQIDPDLGWFFGAIRPGAGDATVEREAFEVASYGKQLGLISEALVSSSSFEISELNAPGIGSVRSDVQLAPAETSQSSSE